MTTPVTRTPRGFAETPLGAAILFACALIAQGANPADYPGSVLNPDGTYTYLFRPSAGANNGTDQGGLTSGKDAFVLNNESSVTGQTNYGAADYTHHFNSNCNPWQGWSYYQWDVSSLPAGNDVVRVVMVLRQRIIRAYGWGYQSPVTVMSLRAPSAPWNEMTLTYANRPPLAPTILAQASLPTDRPIAGVVAPPTLCWFEGYVRVDITSLYREWQAGVRPNYGIAYQRDQAWCENANANYVYTSDNADPAWRPALEITYHGAASDTTAPVITAPADITAEATSAAGATVTFGATATDDQDGPVAVTAVPASGSVFPLGTTAVGLAASDAAGNTGTAEFDITVRDTTPPVLTTPGDQTLEATSATGASASFAATATDAVGVTALTYSRASGSVFPPGATTVTVAARDAAGNTSSGAFTITVVDTTAPAFTSLTASASALWPANHRMVAVGLTAVATDTVGVASLRIVSVTSSEPDNGLGDGDTAGDIQVTGNLSLNLRAERSGTGSGRVYTITVEARDAAGNATTRPVSVTVPKNQSGK